MASLPISQLQTHSNYAQQIQDMQSIQHLQNMGNIQLQLPQQLVNAQIQMLSLQLPPNSQGQQGQVLMTGDINNQQYDPNDGQLVSYCHLYPSIYFQITVITLYFFCSFLSFIIVNLRRWILRRTTKQTM